MIRRRSEDELVVDQSALDPDPDRAELIKSWTPPELEVVSSIDPFRGETCIYTAQCPDSDAETGPQWVRVPSNELLNLEECR